MLHAALGPLTHFAAEDSGISALGIDPWAMLAQGLTFVALFIVAKRYALGKIVDALEKRRIKIEQSVQNALDIESEKERLKKDVQLLLEKAHNDANELLRQAHLDAKQRLAAAEDFAKKRAADILQENQLRIATEVAVARRELKGEVADLVAEATAGILRESLSPAHEKKLIEMYLDEVQT